LLWYSEELIGAAEYVTLYTRCRITHVVITGFDCVVIILRNPLFGINYLASEWLKCLLVSNARLEYVAFCFVLGILELKSWTCNHPSSSSGGLHVLIRINLSVLSSTKVI
jgi:hypothetical protein